MHKSISLSVLGMAVALAACVGSAVQAAKLRTRLGTQPVVRQVSARHRPVALDGASQDGAATRSGSTVLGPQLEPADSSLVEQWHDSWDDHFDPSCGTGGRMLEYWGSFEILMWWRKSQDAMALVTTSPTGTASSTAGILGQPTTSTLYSTETLSGDVRPGGRLSVGAWLDRYHCHGVGTRLFILGETSANYQTSDNEWPILARPFNNAALGQADADLVAYPGISTGSITIDNVSRVGGGDIFYRRQFVADGCQRVDLIVGYQFARIDEDLQIVTNRTSIATGGTIPVGTVIDSFDQFETENTYSAAVLGFLASYDRGPLSWNLVAKIGLGNMRQRVRINGGTTNTVPGQAPTSTNQGLLALQTNIGAYQQDVFTVSPEIGLSMACHLNECVDLTLGYTFLYWNHVAQAGQQIDPSINTTQLTGALNGAAVPAFAFRDSGYYVHGLNLGLTWIW